MKDLYIEEYDRLVSLYEEQGMTEADARALADDRHNRGYPNRPSL